jgi:hypothetical protein
MYTTCTGLLTSSGGAYPGSSVFEINANGVSLNKIVIGKPASQGDAGSGYMSPSALASCLVTAMNKGWSECVTRLYFHTAHRLRVYLQALVS